MLFKPNHFPLMLFDAPADNGGGGDAKPAGDPQPNPAEIADFEAWLKDQPEPVKKAYEAHTGRLKSALDSERETRKKLESERKAAEKAQTDAAAETAKKNGEWQKLAEQRERELADLQARIAEVEPLRGQAEKYQKALEAQLREAKKAVPAHILPLLEKLPVDEQLEYIATNAASFKSPAGGPPPSPKPADPSEAEKAKKEAFRAQYERTVKNMF